MKDNAVNPPSLHASQDTMQIIDEAAGEPFGNTTVLYMDTKCRTLVVHDESKGVQTNIASVVVPHINESHRSYHSVGDNNQFDFDITEDNAMFHYFKGLTLPQFQHLYNFISADVSQLNYWCGSKTNTNTS